MVEKTIQWFRNNWFLWVILILAYITIRTLGYDIKIINVANVKQITLDYYSNNLDGYKKYLEDNRIDSNKAIELESGRFKQDSSLNDDFIQEYKDGNFK
jgi:hypothetical protein